MPCVEYWMHHSKEKKTNLVKLQTCTVSIMFQQCVLSSIYIHFNPMKHTVNLQTRHLACPSYKLEMRQ